MRFTFKKEERLYGHAALDDVFRKGKIIQCKYLKVIFTEFPTYQVPPCRVVFSVPKRNFKKAVERNRIKRRMREIYRHQKNLLYENFSGKQKTIHLYMIYQAKDIVSFEELEENMKQSLALLTNKVN